MLGLIALNVVAFAASNQELEAFMKANLARNPNFTFNKFSVVSRSKVAALSGWEKVDFVLSVKPKNAQLPIENADSLYTYKNFIAPKVIEAQKAAKQGRLDDQQLIDQVFLLYANYPNIKLNAARIVKRAKYKEIAGFETAQFIMDLETKQDARTMSASEIWFVSGNYILPEIISTTGLNSLKNSIKGEVKAEHYRDDRLISGSKGSKAKYKFLVFSDPLCPACRNLMPQLFALAANNPEQISLYYYNMPTHRESPVLMKAAFIAHAQGDKGIELAMYKNDEIKKVIGQSDEEILKTFNRLFDKKITLEAIRESKPTEFFNLDEQTGNDLMVNMTPTIFINGVFDEQRKQYEGIRNELSR
jgi:protein-disulfide isomerase